MAKAKKTAQRLGFLRSDKDISYFITYVMTLLPGPITYNDLLDICLIDEAFGYFEFKAQFDRLVDIGVIYRDNKQELPYYFATKKCTDNIEELRTSLPAAVKDKAQSAVARVIRKMRRNSSIQKSCVENPDGTYNATLAVVDGEDILFKLEIMLVNKRNVDMVFENFQTNAEYYYRNIINELMEFPKEEQCEK